MGTLGGRGSRRRIAGYIVILGGVLILISGFSEHGIIDKIIVYLSQNSQQLVHGAAQPWVTAILSMLSILIGLGGITVIGGGWCITRGLVLIGRVLVGLGGSIGILGFLVTFGYSLYTSGLDAITIHAIYWIGLIFSALGAQLAK